MLAGRPVGPHLAGGAGGQQPAAGVGRAGGQVAVQQLAGRPYSRAATARSASARCRVPRPLPEHVPAGPGGDRGDERDRGHGPAPPAEPAPHRPHALHLRPPPPARPSIPLGNAVVPVGPQPVKRLLGAVRPLDRQPARRLRPQPEHQPPVPAGRVRPAPLGEPGQPLSAGRQRRRGPDHVGVVLADQPHARASGCPLPADAPQDGDRLVDVADDQVGPAVVVQVAEGRPAGQVRGLEVGPAPLAGTSLNFPPPWFMQQHRLLPPAASLPVG